MASIGKSGPCLFLHKYGLLCPVGSLGWVGYILVDLSVHYLWAAWSVSLSRATDGFYCLCVAGCLGLGGFMGQKKVWVFLCGIGLAFSLSGCVTSSSNEIVDGEMERFRSIESEDWQEVFFDSCTNDWTAQWFLDGLKGSVENSPEGMALSAGPVQGDDSCHVVLWTKPVFEGDIRIDYEYAKLDDSINNVNILYVLASGKRVEGVS